MRKLAMWAAGAVVAVGGFTANASLVVTSTRVAGAPGFDIVRFFAVLTPSAADGDAAATGMQSIDATMTSSGNFVFQFADQNADGLKDWDPTGQFTANDTAGRNNNGATAGSFIRPGDPTGGGGAVFAATIEPAQIFTKDDDFDGVPDPGTDPAVNYANVKQFRIAAVLQGGKDVKAIGGGALIAKAVVPTGATVSLVGSIAADAGPIVQFAVGVPEPTSLGLICLAGLALGRRRRTA